MIKQILLASFLTAAVATPSVSAATAQNPSATQFLTAKTHSHGKTTAVKAKKAKKKKKAKTNGRA